MRVRLTPRAGVAPADAEVLASVDSPPMATLIRLTNKPSDNYFAEMLLKGLALQARGKGTTRAGARLAAGYAKRLGSGARLADGSGLSRADRSSPRQVVTLLSELYELDQTDYAQDFLDLAADSGPRRHARHAHAKRSRALALPRQDRHAVERERPLGLLHRPLGRRLRLLVPHELRVSAGRPRRFRTRWPRR